MRKLTKEEWINFPIGGEFEIYGVSYRVVEVPKGESRCSICDFYKTTKYFDDGENMCEDFVATMYAPCCDGKLRENRKNYAFQTTNENVREKLKNIKY